MKLLLKIIKNELRNLFYSPVDAWILMVIFLLLCSYHYTTIMYLWAKQMELVMSFDAFAKDQKPQDPLPTRYSMILPVVCSQVYYRISTCSFHCSP